MSHMSQDPIPFIEKWLGNDLSGKTVLDYACGTGRHGRLAQKRGAAVTFVDLDVSKVEDLLHHENTSLLQADLELKDHWPLHERQYDFVIVTNYLFRPRLNELFNLVKPDGMILYQTFAEGNEVYSRPKNPDFLLKDRELKKYCDDFEILHFEQGLTAMPSKAIIQRLAAKHIKSMVG